MPFYLICIYKKKVTFYCEIKCKDSDHLPRSIYVNLDTSVISNIFIIPYERELPCFSIGSLALKSTRYWKKASQFLPLSHSPPLSTPPRARTQKSHYSVKLASALQVQVILYSVYTTMYTAQQLAAELLPKRP